jgi:hypothetical protein
MYDFYKTSSAPTVDEVHEFLLDLRGVDSTQIVKSAAASSEIRDRLLGAAAGVGGVGLGIHQYNKSKKNKEGYTARDIERERSRAGQEAAESMGGSKRSRLAERLSDIGTAKDEFLDASPARAGLIGAGVGAGAAGLGMHRLLKNIKKSIPKT